MVTLVARIQHPVSALFVLGGDEEAAVLGGIAATSATDRSTVVEGTGSAAAESTKLTP